MTERMRILFMAEAVTLAHVARPIALARALDPSRYDVAMACDERTHHFLSDQRWPAISLPSISSAQFVGALAAGKPLYDADTLSRYVQDDLAVILDFRPNMIVGDFRLSLSVSARLAGIAYATITNAYWSAYYARRERALPVLPITQHLPISIASLLFRVAQPLAFALHCRPLNQVRRAYGLPSLGANLRTVYTDADYTLYADLPQLFPCVNLPSRHIYLGPILWEPELPKPDWWNNLPDDKPLVYMTMGSSGSPDVACRLLEVLAQMPVTVMAAMPDGLRGANAWPNVYQAQYLPGTQAAARAAVVVCNGGSLTCQQALASGVPLLGVASNMDQFLNMAQLERAGAALTLRVDRLRPDAISIALHRLLNEASFRREAAALRCAFATFDAPSRFARFIDQASGQNGDLINLR